jgi:hypothetical protein
MYMSINRREKDGALSKSLEHKRNPFFLLSGGEKISSDGFLYAAIEVSEDIKNNHAFIEAHIYDLEENNSHYLEPVVLECVEADWVKDLHRNEDHVSWLELYHKALLFALELTDYSMPKIPDNSEIGDVVWFEVGFTPAGLLKGEAKLYTSLYSTGTDINITSCTLMKHGTGGDIPFSETGWIDSTLSQEPTTSFVDRIGKKLKGLDNNAGVALFDVGQGACQAVLDAEMKVPTLYIDFGGGVLGNINTFPSGYINFCFGEDPGIILSHWDWDHWSSAYRFPTALNADWFVPHAPHKPIQQAFAADLLQRGRLHIVPKEITLDLRIGGIHVETCNGKTVNDSGLAVTIYPSRSRRKNCLLPGDASYQYIPSVKSGGKFNTLCITHHGGRLHSSKVPKPKRGGRTVCSVGAGNTYKHPSLATLLEHCNQGWKMPLTTGLTQPRPSHIFVPWEGPPTLYNGGDGRRGTLLSLLSCRGICLEKVV